MSFRTTRKGQNRSHYSSMRQQKQFQKKQTQNKKQKKHENFTRKHFQQNLQFCLHESWSVSSKTLGLYSGGKIVEKHQYGVQIIRKRLVGSILVPIVENGPHKGCGGDDFGGSHERSGSIYLIFVDFFNNLLVNE